MLIYIQIFPCLRHYKIKVADNQLRQIHLLNIQQQLLVSATDSTSGGGHTTHILIRREKIKTKKCLSGVMSAGKEGMEWWQVFILKSKVTEGLSDRRTQDSWVRKAGSPRASQQGRQHPGSSVQLCHRVTGCARWKELGATSPNILHFTV